jgi:hypothetical protein
MPTTPGQLAKFDQTGTVTNSIVTETDTGLIGIGTAAPTAKAEIRVTNEGDWALKLQSGPNDFFDIRPTNVGGRFQTELNTLNNRDLVILLGTGNVGIGTETPAAKLHVAGPVQASSFQGDSGKAIVSGDNGGVVQLFHPNGGNPHIELNANETTLANTGGGGNTTIRLNGHVGTIEAPVHQTTDGKAIVSGDNGGLVQLFHPNGGNPHIELVANELTPENTGGGLVNVTNGGGNTTIRLNGNAGTIEAGDILLTQADCAEDFDLAAGETAEPGSVMVIDHEGALKESHGAYDRKVAGVISGAGDYKAGITLDRQSPGRTGKMPIALSGKVYSKVDASYDPIEVGDLLVTSPTRAHAMKANDPMRAFGAVIGKALRGLQSGRGLIPILVSLQ